MKLLNNILLGLEYLAEACQWKADFLEGNHSTLISEGFLKPRGWRGFYKVKRPLHVWKAAAIHDPTSVAPWMIRYVVVELEIPKGSMVFSDALHNTAKLAMWIDNRKCRADKAIVKSIVGGYAQCHSLQDEEFIYKVGETVKPTEPFSKRNRQCASGIHFFYDRSDAEKWLR